MKSRIGVLGVCLLAVMVAACGRSGSVTTSSESLPTVPTTWSTTTSPATTLQTTTTGPTLTTTTSTPPPARLITRADTSEKVVALTFDAGSDRGNAEQILDLLADEGIQASFGLTGQWAEANPDLVRRMGEAGHTLINHTYDHPHMETLSTTERISELDATESIVSGLTGRSTKPYFRPPFGSYDEQVLDDAGSIGYRFAIMWTVDSLGWKGIPADQVVARCIDGAESGAIFPLHVGSASTDYNALPELIAHLRAAGYGFATIAQLVP